MKIQVLSDQTIDKIAAGEVIENPASVVKELVENGIDAGAREIRIEILSGGFQKIKITDDGMGMSPEDALLCLKRHATSKIIDAEDLFSLSTMGFRGEALASIAAISKMTLATAMENGAATCVEVEGGKITQASPHARSRGTTIEVRSLFYNVPARKKFQKSAAASAAEITRVATQLALAHPEVGFQLVQQNRELFSLPSAMGSEDVQTLLKNRAEALLGKEFMQACLPLTMRDGAYSAVGWIGDPSYTRHNRSGQYLFVNRRPVLCPAISYAVRDAYGTRLSEGRHGVYLLHAAISPDLVDVNVHPQKKEIRLREESMVKYALHSAINQALGQPPISNASLPWMAGEAPDFSEATLVLKEEAAEREEQELLPHLHAIGLYRHYLLVDAKNCPAPLAFDSPGVVWIDLCAVEERLHFDALMKGGEKKGATQGLLIPLTLSFSRAESELLRTHLDSIQSLGIHLREIGQTVFIVEAVPSFLEEGDVQAALEEILGQLEDVQEDRLRHLAARLCRRVRSEKKSYHFAQALHLVQRLLESEDPFRSPLGKKIFFHFKEKEIENSF